MTKDVVAETVVSSQNVEQSLHDSLLHNLNTRMLQQEAIVTRAKRALDEKDSEVDALKKQKTTDKVRIEELQFLLQRSTAAEIPWSELSIKLKAQRDAAATENAALKKELDELKSGDFQLLIDPSYKQNITELSATNLKSLTTINKLRKDLATQKVKMREMEAKAKKDAETIAGLSDSQAMKVKINELDNALSHTKIALAEAVNATFKESEKAKTATEDNVQLSQIVAHLSGKLVQHDSEISRLKSEMDAPHRYLSLSTSPSLGSHSILNSHGFFAHSPLLGSIAVLSPHAASSHVVAVPDPMTTLKI